MQSAPANAEKGLSVAHACRAVCEGGDFEVDSESRTPAAGSRSLPARLRVYQAPRNPTERERGILTLLAEGLTQRQVAAHLGLHPRSVSNALGHMRERYTVPTNEALVALAIRLQWIAIAIDINQF